MDARRPKKRWVIEFWDFGDWDEWATMPEHFTHKQQAIEVAQRLNREVKDRAVFEGHRFRVRNRP